MFTATYNDGLQLKSLLVSWNVQLKRVIVSVQNKLSHVVCGKHTCNDIV